MIQLADITGNYFNHLYDPFIVCLLSTLLLLNGLISVITQEIVSITLMILFVTIYHHSVLQLADIRYKIENYFNHPYNPIGHPLSSVHATTNQLTLFIIIISNIQITLVTLCHLSIPLLFNWLCFTKSY